MSTRKDFEWLGDKSRDFLAKGYLTGGQTAENRIREIADNAQRILDLDGFSDKFYNYMAKGYYSLSSPVWSNFGNDRGLPISCYGSYVGDSIGGIMGTASEVAMMSKLGGGTSGYFGAIRERGASISGNGTSNGSFPFLSIFDTTVDVVSQGSTRRGRMAAYMDIEHGDVAEWLNIQTEGNPIQGLFYGICVGNKWLDEMKAGDSSKRQIWAKIIKSRSETGIPYLLFKDNVNNNTVDVYKDKGMTIHASNLCTEIMLPSSEDESFVCCLSSMNAVHFDEWERTDAVETLTFFLDAVMSEFISKLEVLRDTDDLEDNETFNQMKKAYKFAVRHRALGLGVLGWHSSLQKKMIPFESFEAMQLNAKLFKTIKIQSLHASEKLAEMYGEPELLKGYGRRNTTLTAVAPTKSSSFILGEVSMGIEPIMSNYNVNDTAKAKVTYKNPLLIEILKGYDKDTMSIWRTILERDGSIQHLKFLTDNERNVFKTYLEISQLAVIQQAASRQAFICQAQSLNLLIHPSTPTKDINKLMLTAVELGIKSLYYQHNVSAAQEFSRALLDCDSCGS